MFIIKALAFQIMLQVAINTQIRTKSIISILSGVYYRIKFIIQYNSLSVYFTNNLNSF